MHVLIVDDDPSIRAALGQLLTSDGYAVTAIARGAELDAALDGNRIDLVVLDLVLPGESGFDILRRLRDRSQIGVIVVSGLSDLSDRIASLELGADDYMAKPFAPSEFIARVGSLARRASVRRAPDPSNTLHFDGWTIDLRGRQLLDPDNSRMAVTSGEFALLEALVLNAGRPVTREELMKSTAIGNSDRPDARSVDVLMSRLRRKLGDSGRTPRLIRTVWGSGYILDAEVVGDRGPYMHG